LPGFINASRSTLLFAPNLPGWENWPLAETLRLEVGLPVVLENDANAAAWGEAVFGAGRGHRDLACVTLGTGVGGGLILDGRLHRGRWGFAGELGHMQVKTAGRPCGCGLQGCWEQYTNGSALRKEAQEQAARQGAEAAVLLSYGDGTLDGIEAAHVTKAASRQDPVAMKSLDTVGTWLGRGLATLSALLDPALFVIGGGVSVAGELLLEPARRALADALPAQSHRSLPELRCAQLGNDAGMVGAAHLAVLANPPL